jgi:transcriptional regulator with XRE-family HTH domain
MVSTKIRFLRDSKNWSQDYVATKLNITQTAYSKLEGGLTKLTTERITQLAELYNVDEHFFLSDDQPTLNYYNCNDNKAIINPQNYNEMPKEHFTELLNSKDTTITILKGELELKNKEIEQLIKLIERLSQ